MNASVRGGVFRSSGDQNSADGEHGTFFQILPTPRVYVRIPFYSGMNSTDLFVHVSLKPTARLTVTSEIHRLSLTERSDLWYSGGGAFQDETFGFAGRPAGGGDELGIVGDVNADFALTSKTTLTVYLASARGGNVIRSIYGDRTASFAYFEVLRRF